MALNREDIILQIKDNMEYYAIHAGVEAPGKEYALGASEALAELLIQIDKYDKFISLEELMKAIDFTKFKAT